MTTIAYIANEFPSSLEPYVMDEIKELRGRGVRVICCSGKRVLPQALTLAERALWKETLYFQPLSDDQLVRALRRLASDPHSLGIFLRPLLWERGSSLGLRIRGLGHTLMGATLAEQMDALDVQHIHAHHGYFASWMAMVAAQLLGIGFSLTLHGSDLLQRADLLSAKLQACQFCVTVSEYNRQYILRKYPLTAPEKVIVQRLGVDRPTTLPPTSTEVANRKFALLSVGRLHSVKNHRFLIEALSALRDRGLDFVCWLVGEGPERARIEDDIAAHDLHGLVHLTGHVQRAELSSYYRHADLIVSTSKSEGVPVVLMEAMAHEKLVLAPAITGIPELVEHRRTGFLYKPDSLPDFTNNVLWIHAHRYSLREIQRAAAASVACSYNRQQNLRKFAEHVMSRISPSENPHAHPVLQ